MIHSRERAISLCNHHLALARRILHENPADGSAQLHGLQAYRWHLVTLLPPTVPAPAVLPFTVKYYRSLVPEGPLEFAEIIELEELESRSDWMQQLLTGPVLREESRPGQIPLKDTSGLSAAELLDELESLIMRQRQDSIEC